jgi:hypothetical protein
MKSQSQILRQVGRHRSDETQLRSEHPVIDYHYHPASGDLRGVNGRLKLSAPSAARSLRNLSSEFLSAEMKRDYVTEALCFLIIVSVSAWPIVSMVRALSLLK